MNYSVNHVIVIKFYLYNLFLYNVGSGKNCFITLDVKIKYIIITFVIDATLNASKLKILFIL